MEKYLELIISILSGIAVCIPLVRQLVKTVQNLVRERNWNKIVKEMLRFMECAELLYETGAERKEWVMSMVKETADELKYDVDMDAISGLIDAVCDASKILTAKKKAGEENA